MLRSDDLSPRLLMVEPYDPEARMLQQVFERDGFRVVVASSVAEALRRLVESRFDVVLTASCSGSEDVLGPTRQVLQAAGTTPVVLHTGYDIDWREALAAGFADLIEKPSNIFLLVARVRAFLSDDLD